MCALFRLRSRYGNRKCCIHDICVIIHLFNISTSNKKQMTNHGLHTSTIKMVITSPIIFLMKSDSYIMKSGTLSGVDFGTNLLDSGGQPGYVLLLLHALTNMSDNLFHFP